MRPVQQLPKGGIPAQKRVYLHVVEGMVTVIRGRAEDRVQVEGVYTQILQVVQAVHDTQKIAALKALFRWRCTPGFELDSGKVLQTGAATEPVRKDLIENRVLNPIWCLDAHHRPNVIGEEIEAMEACDAWSFNLIVA